MQYLTYFKPKDGLPDPKGLLSSILPIQAISFANKEVSARKEIQRKTTQFFTATENVSIHFIVELTLTEQTSPRTTIFVHVVTTNTGFTLNFFD
jgi:hypothetical protein